MPSRRERLRALACNTDSRLVKSKHLLDVHRTPRDRHAAPVTALRIRGPFAVSEWTSQLPHRGICGILQGLSRLRVCSNAAKNVRTPIPYQQGSSPHANDSAPTVIHQLSPAISSEARPRGLANAPALQQEKPGATPTHMRMQYLRTAATPPLEHC